tara:strand:- start:48 stop:248 length:201 start_codon:yes stop_codon:yes gene_type:complete
MLINVNNITQHCNYKKERMNFEERFYFRRNRRRKGRKRGRGLEGFDIAATSVLKYYISTKRSSRSS